MKKINFISMAFASLLSLSTANANGTSMIKTKDFEVIKAEIIDSTPSNFTINVWKFSNFNVDQNAAFFSIYTSSTRPRECSDFRNINLPYSKPKKYLRQFNLSEHPEILKAIDETNCIVVKNISTP